MKGHCRNPDCRRAVSDGRLYCSYACRDDVKFPGRRERNADILRLVRSGMSYAKVGRVYGLSRQRIRAVVEAS